MSLELFTHLCRESVLVLDVKINEIKELVNKALIVQTSALELFNQRPSKETYKHLREADKVTDGMVKQLTTIQDTQDHLKYADKELYDQWTNMRSTIKYKDLSNPSSIRKQEIQLLLRLAHTQMKSSLYRLCKSS